MTSRNRFFTLLIATILLFGCGNSKDGQENDNSKNNTLNSFERRALETTKKSTIYEANIRQYTPGGTFKAFAKHLPRLKKMGVDILWLMPIHPIGEKNRKGSLGSYYSVKDYKDINPSFGTKEDFKELVKKIHDNDMLVIIDWVANHTAWDHPWIKNHPEWYTKDSTGEIIAPIPDWTDVADLNYSNKAMREEMIEALKYWVKEFNIDGYRCDVAGMVPTNFWNTVRPELEKIKPVFMLAEAEQPNLHNVAFDACYAWNLHHIMNEIAKGKKNAIDLKKYFRKQEKKFGKDVYQMAFTTNHDENSWNGTVFERMPNSYKTFAVMTFTVPSLPLIYSGQEAGLNKRLKFFEKDTIQWEEHEMEELYSKLIKLKKENPALWNGSYGGDMKILKTTSPGKTFAFIRKKGDNNVLAVFNLSGKNVKIELKDKLEEKEFVDYFTSEQVSIDKTINLKGWDYRVLIF